ncbi:hypothetical protein SAMN05216241_102433 [Limimonas halophila]|uniref:Uncharacterized protein n=1 Tax=Limimonas halophila TaxID=1082479 RepID=A0A1G7P4U6_9PROT|nr:hypothetical protein [Limimonas halophila]SDF81332.1 hypothetical protein SAMN05216241_102433 [Limimonas halophila]
MVTRIRTTKAIPEPHSDQEPEAEHGGGPLACESLDPNIPCKCRDAVVRCYREMMEKGASHTDAHLVAARVYSYHHPGQPANQVNRLITELVERRALH